MQFNCNKSQLNETHELCKTTMNSSNRHNDPIGLSKTTLIKHGIPLRFN